MSAIIVNLPANVKYVYAENFSEIVVEQKSLRVLNETNMDSKLPMASTTKILTAITVIENSNLSDLVTVTAETVGIEGSSIYLKEGELLTVEELLYGLMLRSGNDAAATLAKHVGNTIENFVDMMNITAKKCGAVNSNFTNPHGLHDDNHYTTAHDLALISCYALNNEQFRKIVSTKKIEFSNRTFINKNKMLESFEGCDGIKTGYTVHAGRCLVTSATRAGMQLVSVVLNCPKMYERTKELLEDCFSKYKMNCVLKKGVKIGSVILKNGITNDEKEDVYLSDDLIIPMTEKEVLNTKIIFEPSLNFEFPINIGDYIGKISVYVGKDLIFFSKLFTIYEKTNYSLKDIFNGIAVRWRVYEN